MTADVVEGVVLPRVDLAPLPDPAPAWDPDAWRRPHPGAVPEQRRGLVAEFWSHPFLRETTYTAVLGVALALTVPTWVWLAGGVQAVAVVREIARWENWRRVYHRPRAVWVTVQVADDMED